MELQYSKKYNPIGLYGCYFISLGLWAEELEKKSLTSDQVLEVYNKAVTNEHMNPKCFIKHPDIILNYFLAKLKSDLLVVYIGWWNEDSGKTFKEGYSDRDISFRIDRHKTSTGHHFKTPGFDPGPKYKRELEVNGHRYFKIIK